MKKKILLAAAIVWWVGGSVWLLSSTVVSMRAEPAATVQYHLPIILANSQPAANPCEIPNTRYEALSVMGPPISGNVETDIDLNLGYRGYTLVNAPLTLVTYDAPVIDRKAPQLAAMFSDNRVPKFSATYHRFRWDPGCNCPVDAFSPWPTTVLGLQTQVLEVIGAPDSGYDIGGGKEYLVLYAGDTGITLHIGRDDGLVGYTVHIEGLCVEPDLLTLYRQLNAAGRQSLPALSARQPIGRAIEAEIRVAVRDYGHFLDPRSRNDWWQGR